MRAWKLILTFLATASAGLPKPEVTVGLNVGEDAKGSLGGLEPKVKWQTAGSLVGFDVEGGVDVTVSDVDEAPATFLWGKLKRTIPKFGDLSIKGGMDATAREYVGLDMSANAFGTSVQVLGSADTAAKKLSVSKVQLTADIDAPGGKLTVNPSYNLDKSTPDCRLGYSIDGTSVQVDAQGKKMTIAHCFDNNDVIAPSVSASGDFSLSYTRSLEGGKLTTTWAPNKAVQLQWADGDWQTTMKAPLDGLYKTNQGIKVSMKRTVGVF